MSKNSPREYGHLPNYREHIQAFRPHPTDPKQMLSCVLDHPNAYIFRLNIGSISNDYDTLLQAERAADLVVNGHRFGYNQRVQEEQAFHEHRLKGPFEY
jgi:hypothetical protein